MPRQSTRILTNCYTCGTSISREPSRVRARMYCSHTCRAKDAPTIDPVERFWLHVQKSDGCWLWTGERTAHGYGRVWVSRKDRPQAHRFSYELHYGPIPDGLHVCHHCDTPLCIRPDHLFLGTDADNMQDAAAKGRVPHGESHWTTRTPEKAPRGERNGQAKLMPAQVLAIRADYATGLQTHDSLALTYGIGRTQILRIVNRQRWKNI